MTEPLTEAELAERVLDALCDSDGGNNPFYHDDADTIQLANELAEHVWTALAPLLAAARAVVGIDPFDYEQDLCYWCGGGWERVRKGKMDHTGKHADACPYAALRALTAKLREAHDDH